VVIPVDEMPFQDLDSVRLDPYYTAAVGHDMGVCLYMHNPDDLSQRIELSHTPLSNSAAGHRQLNFPTEPGGASWFWDGDDSLIDEVLTRAQGYTWAAFKADLVFKSWRIYKITLDYGYATGDITMDGCYLSQVFINGAKILLRPSAIETATSKKLQSYTEHLGQGLVATDGIQFSPVATVGTTAVTVLDELIDPGENWDIKELEVSFVQKFTELTGGTTAGSLSYYWQIRSEYRDAAGVEATTNFVAVNTAVGMGIASAANAENTVEGYVIVGSIPKAPVRIQMKATALYADAFEAKVKNTSYVRMVGTVIPGT